MSRCWIGVDLGTGSVRALAVDDAGAVLAAATRPLASRRARGPDGGARHEQDPAAWVDAVAGALAEVVAALRGRPVTGLAVDGTSGTIVLTDADGKPLTPGVMYDDARGVPYAGRVRDAGRDLWARLGHGMGATWALPTLLALRPEHPGARVAHQVDVVTGWLAGAPTATDENTALKTGYDALDRRWPADVLDALGVDPALLPDVVPAGTPIGTVGAAASRSTGLPAGVPLYAGTTDGCAAQIGAGAVRPGAWHAVLGTTLVLKGVTTTLVPDPDGTVYSHRAPEHGWWPGGASSVGAGVLSSLLAPSRFAALTDAASALAPDGVPVVFPLDGRGERFPFAAPDAEGFWFSARGSGSGAGSRPLSTLVEGVGEAAAFAGICTGVAFVERLAFAHLDALGADVTGPRTTSGGATANRWWTRLRADVTGHPLRLPAVTEPAFGSAVLAACGASAGHDLVATADAMVRVVETVEPRGAASATAADERYAAFVAALRARGWIAP